MTEYAADAPGRHLTMPTSPRPRRPLVAAAALAILLAGCGTAGEDDPGAADGAPGDLLPTDGVESEDTGAVDESSEGGDAHEGGETSPDGAVDETGGAGTSDESGDPSPSPSEDEDWGSWENLGTDGIPGCDVLDLPATALNTIDDIEVGGPYEFPRNDGITFQNREGILPDETGGYYREFTVVTPGLDHRGARRIVTGGPEETDPDHWYYTEDHYESFCEFDPAGLDF